MFMKFFSSTLNLLYLVIWTACYKLNLYCWLDALSTYTYIEILHLIQWVIPSVKGPTLEIVWKELQFQVYNVFTVFYCLLFSLEYTDPSVQCVYSVLPSALLFGVFTKFRIVSLKYMHISWIFPHYFFYSSS